MSQKNFKEVVSEIKALHPFFLEGFGLEVESKNSERISIKKDGKELFRALLGRDGNYAYFHKNTERIGDSIDFGRILFPQKNFKEIVELFSKSEINQDKVLSYNKKKELDIDLKIPSQTKEDIEIGRSYLKNERGLSCSILQRMEEEGRLRYMKNACVFIGRDENNKIKNATKRYIAPKEGVPSKMDFKDANKKYPFFIQNSKQLFIVESAIDAMALCDLHRRRGKEPPSVIATGGIGVRKFLESDSIKNLILSSEEIKIFFDKEDTPEKQENTQKMATILAKRIEREFGKNPTVKICKSNLGKDFAEINKNDPLRLENEAACELERGV